jgi:hypothetical protein
MASISLVVAGRMESGIFNDPVATEALVASEAEAVPARSHRRVMGSIP